MQREIQVGSITWLNGIPTPLWFAGTCEALEPVWVPRIYMVLKATSNPAPETAVADFKQFQAGKQYRALTYCRCQLDIDSATGELTKLQVLEAIHDPGWTPPFRYTEFPPSLTPELFANADLRDPSWYPGEASALSRLRVGELHENSSIDGVPNSEQILVNAVLKCRAGSHADEVGIRLGSPFHVPWIWNEWLLTYAPGQLKLYMRSSKYPSHGWYVDGKRVAAAAQIGDASFPELPRTPAPGVYGVPPAPSRPRINVPRLALYPNFLSKGAPASDPQTPSGSAEQARRGPVAVHPNTVPGWQITVVAL